MPGDFERPERKIPSHDWEHFQLYENVGRCLAGIPEYFRSTISVMGVGVTEIYSFSTVLGLTIEQEVIRTLNDLRSEWDPTGNYRDFHFIRQAQTFPDVLFANPATGQIIMGIELKSWYLLAKEGEPSFRYQVTVEACAVQDLLVVIPWVLSNVLSGNPIVLKPYIETARYVAEYRNYWWRSIRKSKSSEEIISPLDVTPYPSAKTQISDMPVSDSGNNFGRIARIGLLDEYVQSFQDYNLLGVRTADWRRFLKEQVERNADYFSDE